MSDITISKNVSVDVKTLNPLQPLPEGATDLLNVNFGGEGGEPFKLGAEGTMTASVKGGTHASITPIWAATAGVQSKTLEDFDLQGFFAGGANDDKVLLALCAGAEASAGATASFRYSILNASATVDIGADG